MEPIFPVKSTHSTLETAMERGKVGDSKNSHTGIRIDPREYKLEVVGRGLLRKRPRRYPRYTDYTWSPNNNSSSTCRSTISAPPIMHNNIIRHANRNAVPTAVADANMDDDDQIKVHNGGGNTGNNGSRFQRDSNNCNALEAVSFFSDSSSSDSPGGGGFGGRGVHDSVISNTTNYSPGPKPDSAYHSEYHPEPDGDHKANLIIMDQCYRSMLHHGVDYRDDDAPFSANSPMMTSLLSMPRPPTPYRSRRRHCCSACSGHHKVDAAATCKHAVCDSSRARKSIERNDAYHHPHHPDQQNQQQEEQDDYRRSRSPTGGGPGGAEGHQVLETHNTVVDTQEEVEQLEGGRQTSAAGSAAGDGDDKHVNSYFRREQGEIDYKATNSKETTEIKTLEYEEKVEKREDYYFDDDDDDPVDAYTSSWSIPTDDGGSSLTDDDDYWRHPGGNHYISDSITSSPLSTFDEFCQSPGPLHYTLGKSYNNRSEEDPKLGVGCGFYYETTDDLTFNNATGNVVSRGNTARRTTLYAKEIINQRQLDDGDDDSATPCSFSVENLQFGLVYRRSREVKGKPINPDKTGPILQKPKIHRGISKKKKRSHQAIAGLTPTGSGTYVLSSASSRHLDSQQIQDKFNEKKEETLEKQSFPLVRRPGSAAMLNSNPCSSCSGEADSESTPPLQGRRSESELVLSLTLADPPLPPINSETVILERSALDLKVEPQLGNHQTGENRDMNGKDLRARGVIDVSSHSADSMTMGLQAHELPSLRVITASPAGVDKVVRRHVMSSELEVENRLKIKDGANLDAKHLRIGALDIRDSDALADKMAVEKIQRKSTSLNTEHHKKHAAGVTCQSDGCYVTIATTAETADRYCDGQRGKEKPPPDPLLAGRKDNHQLNSTFIISASGSAAFRDAPDKHLDIGSASSELKPAAKHTNMSDLATDGGDNHSGHSNSDPGLFDQQCAVSARSATVILEASGNTNENNSTTYRPYPQQDDNGTGIGTKGQTEENGSGLDENGCASNAADLLAEVPADSRKGLSHGEESPCEEYSSDRAQHKESSVNDPKEKKEEEEREKEKEMEEEEGGNDLPAREPMSHQGGDPAVREGSHGTLPYKPEVGNDFFHLNTATTMEVSETTGQMQQQMQVERHVEMNLSDKIMLGSEWENESTNELARSPTPTPYSVRSDFIEVEEIQSDGNNNSEVRNSNSRDLDNHSEAHDHNTEAFDHNSESCNNNLAACHDNSEVYDDNSEIYDNNDNNSEASNIDSEACAKNSEPCDKNSEVHGNNSKAYSSHSKACGSNTEARDSDSDACDNKPMTVGNNPAPCNNNSEAHDNISGDCNVHSAAPDNIYSKALCIDKSHTRNSQDASAPNAQQEIETWSKTGHDSKAQVRQEADCQNPPGSAQEEDCTRHSSCLNEGAMKEGAEEVEEQWKEESFHDGSTPFNQTPTPTPTILYPTIYPTPNTPSPTNTNAISGDTKPVAAEPMNDQYNYEDDFEDVEEEVKAASLGTGATASPVAAPRTGFSPDKSTVTIKASGDAASLGLQVLPLETEEGKREEGGKEGIEKEEGKKEEGGNKGENNKLSAPPQQQAMAQDQESSPSEVDNKKEDGDKTISRTTADNPMKVKVGTSTDVLHGRKSAIKSRVDHGQNRPRVQNEKVARQQHAGYRQVSRTWRSTRNTNPPPPGVNKKPTGGQEQQRQASPSSSPSSVAKPIGGAAGRHRLPPYKLTGSLKSVYGVRSETTANRKSRAVTGSLSTLKKDASHRSSVKKGERGNSSPRRPASISDKSASMLPAVAMDKAEARADSVSPPKHNSICAHLNSTASAGSIKSAQSTHSNASTCTKSSSGKNSSSSPVETAVPTFGPPHTIRAFGASARRLRQEAEKPTFALPPPFLMMDTQEEEGELVGKADEASPEQEGHRASPAHPGGSHHHHSDHQQQQQEQQEQQHSRGRPNRPCYNTHTTLNAVHTTTQKLSANTSGHRRQRAVGSSSTASTVASRQKSLPGLAPSSSSNTLHSDVFWQSGQLHIHVHGPARLLSPLTNNTSATSPSTVDAAQGAEDKVEKPTVPLDVRITLVRSDNLHHRNNNNNNNKNNSSSRCNGNRNNGRTNISHKSQLTEAGLGVNRKYQHSRATAAANVAAASSPGSPTNRSILDTRAAHAQFNTKMARVTAMPRSSESSGIRMRQLDTAGARHAGGNRRGSHCSAGSDDK